MMISINVSQEKLDILAATFGCKRGTLPITYLGLPLGTTKPRVQDFSPTLDRIERRLVACFSFLSYGGRLTLINSVLPFLLTYYMCTLKLMVKVIEHIDRARRHCLWSGNDLNAKKNSLAAWTKVCKPKNKGGLGIIDIQLQNEGLLMKNLHKFYNKMDLPWVRLIWSSYYQNEVPHATKEIGSFWWKDIMRLNIILRGIAQRKVQKGDCTFLVGQLEWKQSCS